MYIAVFSSSVKDVTSQTFPVNAIFFNVMFLLVAVAFTLNGVIADFKSVGSYFHNRRSLCNYGLCLAVCRLEASAAVTK